MEKEQSFDQQPLPRIFRTVYFALQLSIRFTLTSSPLLLAILFCRNTPELYGGIGLATYSLGPAVYGVVSSLNRLMEEEDLPSGIYFFQSIWHGRHVALAEWTILWVAALLYVINMFGFRNTSVSYLNIVFTIGLGAIFSVFLNSVYFAVRNPTQPTTHIVMTAFYFALKKWYRGAVNVALFAGLLGGMWFVPPIGFILLPSVILSIIFFNNRQLLKQ